MSQSCLFLLLIIADNFTCQKDRNNIPLKNYNIKHLMILNVT